ncbi:MAG: ComEA family DNA-binding protein [Ruminococcus sp.]|jgi:comEA protein|nr:ComEA family DNA-binding protein [Ruminococcus sp.]
MRKINTDSKLYFAVSCTLALCLAIILIYREIPHTKEEKSAPLSEVFLPQPLPASFTVTSACITEALPEEAFQTVQSDSTQKLININTADADTLMQLKGIGEKKALAIIEYRNSAKGFSSTDELTMVNGIGEKTLDAIRDFICV